MQKNHFEILLEDMRHNFQLAFEKFDSVDGRLDTVDSRLETMDKCLSKLELNVKDVKSDVREVKRSVGLFQSIANDHEARIQNLEEAIRHRQ